MTGPTMEGNGPLRILHVLRAPLGGLFRHVLDLAREQVARGHAVGLVADSGTGGEAARAALAQLAPHLGLGLSRLLMRREPHISDVRVLAHVLDRVRRAAPHVVHGHGSKGGVFARVPGFLPGGRAVVRAYTPHGGSLNHRPDTRASRAYMAVERVLAARTDLVLFESAFIAERYRALVGPPRHLSAVVHNGIAASEFAPVRAQRDAADFVYVGELRAAKGIDVFLEALAVVGRILGRDVRAILVGSGPDEAALKVHAAALGLCDHVSFVGPMRAREAFARGRVLVVPSRAESLPYIALEAAAAEVPLVATDVGGIPEIFGPYRDRLVPADDVPGLAARMVGVVTADPGSTAEDARRLAASVRDRFSIDAMVDGVVAAYRAALAPRADARRPASPALDPLPLRSRARP